MNMKRLYLYGFAFGALFTWALTALVLIWGWGGLALARLLLLANLLMAGVVYLDDSETDFPPPPGTADKPPRPRSRSKVSSPPA
jgi:hypothetical protein